MEILTPIMYKEKQNVPKENATMAQEMQNQSTLDMTGLSLSQIFSGLFFFLGTYNFSKVEFCKFFIESPHTESWRQRFAGNKRHEQKSLEALLDFYRMCNQVIVVGDALYCGNLAMNVSRKEALEEDEDDRRDKIFPKYRNFFSDLAGKFKEFTMTERSRPR